MHPSEPLHGGFAQLYDVADALDQPARIRIHGQCEHEMVGAQAHVIEASGDSQGAVEAIRCRRLEARHLLVVVEVQGDFFSRLRLTVRPRIGKGAAFVWGAVPAAAVRLL